jgi:uncharacterized membrane protein YhaH (DUF805 family)
MINLIFIAPFLILIFLGKKNIVIKIFQFYFKSLFTQAIDVRSRTSNAWLYIFSFINAFIFTKVFMGVDVIFSGLSSASPVTLIKFVIFCLCVVSSLSIMVRRLHDINKPGWWLIIGIVFPPILIILSFMFLFPGTDGSNKYGPDPKKLPYWYLR